jgi:hypothetical protein
MGLHWRQCLFDPTGYPRRVNKDSVSLLGKPPNYFTECNDGRFYFLEGVDSVSNRMEAILRIDFLLFINLVASFLIFFFR